MKHRRIHLLKEKLKNLELKLAEKEGQKSEEKGELTESQLTEKNN